MSATVAELLRSELSKQRDGMPYPGFRPFRREEWPIFFGRERQVQALLGLLKKHHFICIHGPSGGGKSSLIEAGLIATLERERRRLGVTWHSATLRPGTNPLWNLAYGLTRALNYRVAAPEADNAEPTAKSRPGVINPEIPAAVEVYSLLTRPGGSIALAARECGLKEEDRLLLVVDQFEELFRLRALGDRRDTQPFIELLLDVFDEQPSGIYVALATRTDFLGDCSEVVGLAEAVNAAPYLTPALTEDELRAAIRGPAELFGGNVEPTLVEQLLKDSANAPDRLPILQHALMRLWTVAGRQNSNQLGVDVYRSDAIQGVESALDRHAEEVMASPELAGLERQVEATFKALTELDGQGRAIRRPLPWAQLCAETGNELPPQKKPTESEPKEPTALERVVNRFRAEGTGFLGRPRPEETTFRRDTIVDVAHEALIRRWKRISRPAAGTARREGWLWDQTFDAATYRGLLFQAKSDDQTISPQVLADRLKWWQRQPKTAAWARRLGEDREATDQDALADVDRIDELFKRSEAGRQRQIRSQRLLNAAYFTVGLLVFVFIGVVAWAISERVQRARDVRQAEMISQVEKKRAAELEQQLQAYVVQSAQFIRQQVQAPVAVAAAAPTAADQAQEVAAVAPPVPTTDAAQAEAPGCIGTIWIGSANNLNLRRLDGRPVAIRDIKAQEHFVATKNVRMRQGMPSASYVQQDAIGIVPEGAQIVARGTPVSFDRPGGAQYWLDVGVAGQICSLIYFQYTGSTSENAAAFAERLKKQGYLVPGQQQLSAAQGLAQVRYYYPEDKNSAEQLAKDAMANAKVLGLAGNRQITAVDYTSWARQKPPRGTLELWLDLSND